MAAYARLKNEFMEDEKYHNLRPENACWFANFTKLYIAEIELSSFC